MFGYLHSCLSIFVGFGNEIYFDENGLFSAELVNKELNEISQKILPLMWSEIKTQCLLMKKLLNADADANRLIPIRRKVFSQWVYISLHAYSQAWLVPSSHAVASFSDDGVLVEMGKLATSALADLYGTKYKVGSAAEIRQPASGMSHDWAKARAGIKYSYHVDLRDSHGPYGFLLPGSQIVSTAQEMWQAVKAIVDNLTPGLI